MNWSDKTNLIYAFFRSKDRQKYINSLKNQIKKLEHALYADRTWKVNNEKENNLEVICPCLSKAIKIHESDNDIFVFELYACERCGKKIQIPKLKSKKAIYYYTEETYGLEK